MTKSSQGFLGTRPGARNLALSAVAVAVGLGAGVPQLAMAQSYSFSNVRVEGNERVDASTVASYANISRGETVSAARLNDAYQAVVDSGLFESVELVPQGGTLVIKVTEYPTVNRIGFEGNARIKDEDLQKIVQSQSRRVYSPSTAEADASAIAAAYEQSGRIAATVTPRIIERSDNRVDLVFEIAEGAVVEIERISFVGNRAYSEGRLRRALGTKQAGLLRRLIRSDTFVADRIEFDKQVLKDFYTSRGYVDFQVLSVTPELTRNRDAYLLTFNIREGQKFNFGKITTSSDLTEVDPDEFQQAARVREGDTYTPMAIETTVARMERLAVQKGLNFIRITPRITRNDRDLTLDVEFVVERGPRLFVERIDIEGNATTLDRVVRRQFNTVEGDPFNPREIRQTADRIRALGFFSTADVSAREGTSPDQMIIDVNVEEQPTGTLSFGLSYSQTDGAGAALSFSENNFLGRGQYLSARIDTGTDNATSRLVFVEPAFLGRDVRFRFGATYSQTDTGKYDSEYETQKIEISPSLEFPISENGRFELRYAIGENTFKNYEGDSEVLAREAEDPGQTFSKVGYGFTYDTRRTGLDPNSGIVLKFNQDYAGLGGDLEFIETTALAGVQRMVWNEEVTLRAELEGGALTMLGDSESRVTERYFLNGKMRGFDGNGLGPREGDEALGGNMYAVARFEAEFPLGLPAEYGITGGVFADFGTVWGLDNTGTSSGPVDDDFHLRSAVGVSLFWKTPLGPLRFNFSKAVMKEDYDEEQNFDFTISTRF
ncbi:outer membrane protein assembly factor BamA [Rhodovulum sp. BSW8]|uniref:Outer membrane protein assembly factor BamA n=1 Tax=Rhodovulum visakhapatnamense TaxID=364297 RepID=A0A4R8G7P9_9RHOB|nr:MULTISPECIES: outer membrane protein assembly factor BamA [Rhodovulum]MBL3577763.1 outer membrane protein assembly factor BamA [Rhodovulum visakhapatnamense]RBO54607.1 outer membrane protein assembly factor BamA [Rhodovulum sp. BSW8]TDX32662.1 Beta-barrel assembly machine subunit BamA [Rhodovulum visakhapatnamense]